MFFKVALVFFSFPRDNYPFTVPRRSFLLKKIQSIKLKYETLSDGKQFKNVLRTYVLHKIICYYSLIIIIMLQFGFTRNKDNVISRSKIEKKSK